MSPSCLLCLPTEVLIIILEILQPLDSDRVDWRAATVHTRVPEVEEIGIYSLRASCRRLLDLSTPYAFRRFRLWTSNGTAHHLGVVGNRPQIFDAVKTLHLEFRAQTQSSNDFVHPRLKDIIPRFPDITALHIQDLTSIDESTFEAVAQIRTLKHLWISCLTDEAAYIDVPALQNLTLESLSVCGVTLFADPAYAFRNTKHVYRPLVTLLSGATGKSLRFLHIRRAPETLIHRLNFSLASPLQRLEDIIPVDVQFPSLEVLKLDGVDTSRYWLGRRMGNFPSLHTLVLGNDPIPKVASPTIGWPQLMRLHIGRLHPDEYLIPNCENLTDLSISSPMDQENLEELKATLDIRSLRTTVPLTTLSLCFLLRPGVVSMPVTTQNLYEFFECLQDLEKLSLTSSSDMTMDLWEYHKDNLFKNFSQLKKLRFLKTNLIPVSEEKNKEIQHTEVFQGVAKGIAKLCPKLEALFCHSKRLNSCRKIYILNEEISEAEATVKVATTL
ncbi:hypothetical protein SCHPADRAFT_935554 [Schizopora paradoxa]|uniref:F-box domain-containing protein n=1 Tax=Schizopora paradoxa TaxID=27342 RepID=A0A0H2S4T6_9AGAM|nr:hypothetical protein SCHPADRAFT_935554 [Schizopora paradoxa]